MLNLLTNFIISDAYAEYTSPFTAGSQQGGGLSFIIMIVIFFLFIYFAIWRPQNKRAKEQQNLLKSLTKGDEVTMAGGLLGRITKIADPYIIVSVADHVEVVMQKSSVVSLLPKGTLHSIE